MRPTLTFYSLAVLLVCWLSSCVSVQAQSLDPIFKPTVLKAPLAVGGLQAVNTLAVQADGKILVGGGFDFINGDLTGKLLRLNLDGTPDPTFNMDGLGANGYVSTVLVQPNGKILVGGGFTTFNGQARSMVVRLNTDGSLDNTFTFGSAASVRQIGSLALQPDGKILVGGGLSLQNTPQTGGLVRLNPDGSLDSSFSVGGTLVQGEMIWAILVQPDGKIVVGGTFTDFNRQGIASLVRLTSTGAIDPTFYTANINTTVGPVFTLAQQPDGKLLVGGSFLQLGGQPAKYIARLLPDGTYDNSFQPGTGPNSVVRALYLESSGGILITGSFTQVNGVSRGRVARLSATGSLDASFATGAGVNATTSALALLPTGQILLAGGFTQHDGANYSGLVRLNATTGQAEAAFGPIIEARGTLSQLLPLPSGQMLVSGNFTQLNGQAVAGAANSVRRLNPDGSLDGNFTALATGTLHAVQVDGSFYVTSGTTLRRYLADGTLDNTFTAQAFSSFSSVQGVVALPNGQVFVHGQFNSYGSRTGLSGLIRLNADGTPDNTFVPASAPTDRRVQQVLTQPSGKLVVVSDVVNTFITTVTRLNADGSADNSFSVGSAAGSGASYQVVMQPDGKLLVSGPFTSFNGQAAPYGLTRLTADGAPDPTYTGVTTYYIPRLVQPDGRLLALQSNTPSPGASAALVRLNADGSLDTGFSPVAVPHSIFTNDGNITGIKLQPADNKILLYGSFYYVAGQVRIGLARLTNVGVLATRPALAARPLEVYPNPAHEAVTVRLPATLQARPATLLDLQGRLVRTWTIPARQAEMPLSLETLPAGVYLLQVQDAGGLYQQKVVAH
ncbi:T9SS type A sorting domain-containing protein [Hymenobacter cellulosivorans]|uniref:T9SS type A sorting domain-containing protein n=1 Tax=Hymenobacter cellulosivorans TaxID=2932249 RepID=A0ABY4FD50_9BACT|nr:T9SS type A sorting domain-containing protein [Hymenobacter cellulosivorans]UOQ54076.1 T9SS type A sorting domain-containing protein [Hymenobacter cellulosivorans]